MSTPLVYLASILAFFALILIPLMIFKTERQGKVDLPLEPAHPGKKAKKKRKR